MAIVGLMLKMQIAYDYAGILIEAKKPCPPEGQVWCHALAVTAREYSKSGELLAGSAEANRAGNTFENCDLI